VPDDLKMNTVAGPIAAATATVSPWMPLLAAAVGAGAALIVGILTQLWTGHRENVRWTRERNEREAQWNRERQERQNQCRLPVPLVCCALVCVEEIGDAGCALVRRELASEVAKPCIRAGRVRASRECGHANRYFCGMVYFA
jgi:hypothetical protein